MIDIPAALERAADLIDIYGHGKGNVVLKGDVFCLVTACRQAVIEAAQGDLEAGNDALGVMRPAIVDALGLVARNKWPGHTIITYNDRPQTTHGDATDALRRAAKNLRELADAPA